MKGSLIVVAFFCIGCVVGTFNDSQLEVHNLSMYVLYALMLQVGVSIGSNKNLKVLVKSLRFNMLLVPLATIVGTLLFSAFASLLLSQWSVFDGSGEWFCLLFAFFHFNYTVQRTFPRVTAGNRAWYYCPVGKYLS